jgi:hypothetical protein
MLHAHVRTRMRAPGSRVSSAQDGPRTRRSRVHATRAHGTRDKRVRENRHVQKFAYTYAHGSVERVSPSSLSLSLSLSLSCIAFLLSANHRSVSLYLLVLLLRGCASSLHPFLPHSFTSSRGSEHSLANLPYTFVCLNWVASYTRAWSVNRILNYYSDCVSLEGAPISVGVLVHLFAHPPTLPHLVPRGVFTGTHAWCDDEDEYKYIFCIGRSGPFRQSPQLRVYARLRVMLGKLSDIPRMIFRSRHAYSRIESSHSSRLDPTTRNETIRNVLYGRKARKRVRDFDNLTVASTVFDARLRWNDYARYTREFPRYFLSSSVAGLAEAESDRYF